jgi:hypothetical protein
LESVVGDDVVDDVVLELPLLCGSVFCGTVVGVEVVLADPAPGLGVGVPGEVGYWVPFGYCDPLGYWLPAGLCVPFGYCEPPYWAMAVIPDSATANAALRAKRIENIAITFPEAAIHTCGDALRHPRLLSTLRRGKCCKN